MKIWFKIWENTHLLKSETIEDDTEDTRTHKMRPARTKYFMHWKKYVTCLILENRSGLMRI